MMIRRLVLLGMCSAVVGMLLLAMRMASFSGNSPGGRTLTQRLPTGRPATGVTAGATAGNVRGASVTALRSLPVIRSPPASLQPGEAQPSTVTFVSAFYNLGRGTMDVSPQWSVQRRPLSFYTAGLKKFLAYRFPKVLLCDEESCEIAQQLLAEAPADAGPTELVRRPLSELASSLDQYSLIQNIRNRREWYQQSDMLANSPQAKLQDFAPVVLSKVAFTRDVAHWNPFSTDAFLWFDAAHLCADPTALTPNKQDFIVRYLNKFLITFREYTGSAADVLGFSRSAFNTYLGRSAGDKSAISLARGGVFGGTPAFLDAVAARFTEILDESLTAGYMGTDQNILTILAYRFPELVRRFDSVDSTRTCDLFDTFLHPPMDPMVDGWETRGLNCRYIDSENAVRCFDGVQRCPDEITPAFLEEAKGQAICTEEPGVFFCRFVCSRDGTTTWIGEPCPNDGVSPCPPWPRTKLPQYNPEIAPPRTDLHGPQTEPRPQQPAPAPATHHFTGEELLARADHDVAEKVRANGGFDLRGLGCEIHNGQERCFMQDAEGRELCPPKITSAVLTAGDGQYLCLPETQGYFCTASCGEGTTINWHAHESKWCEENKDNCPPRPPTLPIDTYTLGDWSEVIRPPMQCQRPAVMPKISVVILAYKETDSLRASLKTYEDAQFLEHVDETILYLNARNKEMEELAAKYTGPPYNVKLMGDSNNYGIAQALNWLFGNATNDHVLFLEKDFRLVESLDCALEQLAIGSQMLDEGTAQVVRYRSRHNPGRPNWARILYSGHEDDVFKNQPNLLCNFFHWVDSPDKRWPANFSPCWKGSDGEVDRSKVFYCSKAEFCNWTNNPVLISRSWWHNEYEVHFDEYKNVNPYEDVELYMNWEPNAWNNRPFVVAQGEGLFRHMDKKKWGAR